eukprot:SAG31_NODE_22428_length_525_cov_2.058685_1_plen_54_part_10
MKLKFWKLEMSGSGADAAPLSDPDADADPDVDADPDAAHWAALATMAPRWAAAT